MTCLRAIRDAKKAGRPAANSVRPSVAKGSSGYYDGDGPQRPPTPSGTRRTPHTLPEGVTISSEQLLHRVSAGDPVAVRECVSRFGGLVWALARRSGLPESELDDAVHEIFTELWHNGHKYDETIASEAAFVAIIARRRLIDRRRRISRRPSTQELTELNSGASPVGEPVSKPEISEEAAVAAKAFETLSIEQQRVLRLSVYEGLSHELISRAMGLPLGTVKTHARRGLLRLREMLGKQDSNGQMPAIGPSDSQRLMADEGRVP